MKKVKLSIFLVLFMSLIFPAYGAKPTKEEVRKHLGKIHIPFVANEGQVDSKVSYYANTFAGTVFITKDGELVYSLKGWSIVESFKRGKANPEGLEASSTNVSYFVGKDPKKWKKNIKTYKELNLGYVWKGINVKLKAYGNNIEKIFTVNPNANLQKIRIKVKGALSLNVGKDGDLVVKTKLGDITFRAPIAYQEKKGKKVYVDVAYKLVGKDEYSFELGKSYDPQYPVVIDPIIQSTYLGGILEDVANAIYVTANGVYVAGWTESSDFPGTTGGAQSNYSGVYLGNNAFVAKLSLDLKSLIQATYLGGRSLDVANAIYVTSDGVYVAGYTASSDFPGTTDGAQSDFVGHDNAFVAKLSLDLKSLIQATYLGGRSLDVANAIYVTSDGVYVAGSTDSLDFPATTDGAQSNFSGGYNFIDGYDDAFVAKLSLDLKSLIQATYFGGSYDDDAKAIYVTADGVYVAGYTDSSDFPGTTDGAQSNYSGIFSDAFVAKLSLDFKSLIQATYLGGSSNDDAKAIYVTADGVYVAGYTDSSDFPGTTDGAQSNYSGVYSDAFVAKLSLNLKSLIQSTYLGGSSDDNAKAIYVTSDGVYVAGWTKSSDFPGTTGGAQSDFVGGYGFFSGYGDAFVAKLSLNLKSLIQSTYLGGSSDDNAKAIYVTSDGVYVAGYTDSSDFPATTGGVQSDFGGFSDVFVAKLPLDLAGNTTFNPKPNNPPSINSFHADITSGTAPLTVTFTCFASDNDGNITEYRFDFDGDGTVDEINTSGIVSHIYQNAGNYNATCIAVDNDGATAESNPIAINVSSNSGTSSNDLNSGNNSDSSGSNSNDTSNTTSNAAAGCSYNPYGSSSTMFILLTVLFAISVLRRKLLS